jgi:hypothetical protein
MVSSANNAATLLPIQGGDCKAPSNRYSEWKFIRNFAAMTMNSLAGYVPERARKTMDLT